ncbi:hypothetical protein DNK47_01855 [Mycoplasma wenyonii]|uniref:Uncharacterized protein n=1 Tax=Mycoplasma wenyonii TaxID=65123 RepID=A0A328PPX1_9MOLU|nr:hypothetical protein [Mycoplasma wenyonii]RAO95008.1 hypothetical protein DNK47_01855 [Mycoplasma wenyonii]
MLGLARGIIGVVLVGAGGGIVAYSSLSSKSNHFLNWKNKKLNTEGPILTCGDNKYDIYEMLIKVSEDGKNNMGLGLTVEFKVLKRDGDSSKQPSKIWIRQWGANAKEGYEWGEWMITFNDGKEEHIRYKDKDYGNKFGGFTVDYAIIGCKDAKIELKKSGKGEEQIRNREIKFGIDEKSCKKETNSVTCDLIFNSDSKLKWKEGFKPTITFNN